MLSKQQIQQKQALAELRTFLVVKMGFSYQSALCRLITEEADSIRSNDTLEEIEQSMLVRRVLNEIRSHKRIVNVPKV